MKFSCGYRRNCGNAGVWCIQKIGLGGSTVCDKHLKEAKEYYGPDAKVWRDDYFEHGEQQELDLRFSGEEDSSA